MEPLLHAEPAVDVTIAQGALRGVRAGNVTHFLDVPFAEAARFAEPRLAPPWAGVRDATRRGPICPQPPSRLAAVMGPSAPAVQDEACLTLSVSTPSLEGRRPVMVWLHGGAYVIGSSSHAWYQPDALVTEGDVVVVRANYRLGVFGFLEMPGVSRGNLGTLDQIEALRWVKRNIAAFGGDPDQVTVFGSSAGAHSIATLMAVPEGRDLFRRAILQSAHLGLGFITARGAARAAGALRECLQGDPRTASVEALLAAQTAATLKLAGPAGLNSAPAFGPIAGTAPVPQTDIVDGGATAPTDILIGTNHREMHAYFVVSPPIVALRRVPIVGERLFDGLSAAVTDRVFTRPARRLADVHAQAGARVFLYAFNWAPPDSPLDACHAIELPFVFGSRDAWTEAPMLGGIPWSAIDTLGRAVRRAWTTFARTGDPNAEGDVIWPRHRAGADPGRRFNRAA